VGTEVGAIKHSLCPLKTRTWWGQELIAESTDAVRVELPGQLPLLCFPLIDIRKDRLRDEGRTGTKAVEGPSRPSCRSPSRLESAK
jgi:hypothetical protein